MRVASAERKISGFTLVEMAIVLVIIGIILAGVMKGRDIVRGAQVKQFSQQFAQKWATVVQTYYDKTGQFYIDGGGNGINLAAGTAGSEPDGRCDGGLGGLVNAEGITPVTAPPGPVGVLNSVGIQPCTLIKSKYNQAVVGPATGAAVIASCSVAGGGGTNIVCTAVEGEYAGTAVIEADIVNLTLTDAAGTVQNRNCVLLYNVPTDVGIGLDTAIDGAVAGDAGALMNIETYTIAAGVTTVQAVGAAVNGIAWPAASAGNTQSVAIIMDF